MASLEELKSKYRAVLDKGEDVGMTVQNVNLEGDKLLIRGVVPSDYAKDQLWEAVKKIDPNVSDAVIDVNVQSGMTYAVKSGDTLSKIAKRFYGDADQYKQIASANGIDNPDKIDVGQELQLP